MNAFFKFWTEFSLTSHSDIPSCFLTDSILDPLKNLASVWSDIQSTDISRPISAAFSVVFSIIFYLLGEKSFVLWGQLIPCLQESSICCMRTLWLSGRYPASSTQPPEMIPAVFWPQNHTEQLVLSSVISLPTIINWCFGEITKWEWGCFFGFCFFGLALNGTKYLQSSSVTKDTKKGGGGGKVPLFCCFCWFWKGSWIKAQKAASLWKAH